MEKFRWLVVMALGVEQLHRILYSLFPSKIVISD
jgi:hypothetical protein